MGYMGAIDIQSARNKLMSVWRSERRLTWVCPICRTGLVGSTQVIRQHYVTCLEARPLLDLEGNELGAALAKLARSGVMHI